MHGNDQNMTTHIGQYPGHGIRRLRGRVNQRAIVHDKLHSDSLHVDDSLDSHIGRYRKVNRRVIE
jgi:hypothetical protein